MLKHLYGIAKLGFLLGLLLVQIGLAFAETDETELDETWREEEVSAAWESQEALLVDSADKRLDIVLEPVELSVPEVMHFPLSGRCDYEEERSPGERSLDDHSGDLTSHQHGVPEPMVFDLVRPLGARKGELEANMLFMLPLPGRRPHFGWASEVEYAVTDGVAVEFELPMENWEPEDLKLAVQATLPSPSERFKHGVQLIQQYHFHEKNLALSGVYILGTRLTKKMSLMTINGARNHNLRRRPSLTALLNNTIFYKLSDQVTLGLETNLELKKRKNHYLYMLQLLLGLSSRNSLQIGAGVSHAYHHSPSAVLGLRVIRTR